MFEFDCVIMWLNSHSLLVQFQSIWKCEDVWVLRLNLEFHFHLNRPRIWEWVLDSLKFHIVQYFLKNFSVEFNQNESFNQSSIYPNEKIKQSNEKESISERNEKFTELSWMFFVFQFQTIKPSITNLFFFLLLFIVVHYCCWNWKRNSIFNESKMRNEIIHKLTKLNNDKNKTKKWQRYFGSKKLSISILNFVSWERDKFPFEKTQLHKSKRISNLFVN
jgi:hypothetical protein